MKNYFVEKMREVMKAYWELLNLTNEKIQKNNETYAPEIAERENQALYEGKQKDYQDATAMLDGIVSNIRELLARGNFPSSAELTPDTALFQNPDFALTDGEVEILARKYRDEGNFSMIRMIDAWARRNNRPDLNLYTPVDQLKAYLKLAQAAQFTIDGIHSEQKQHFIPLEIEHFGDPVMCANEYEIIGDGQSIKGLSKKSVPNEAVHVFDSVTL